MAYPTFSGTTELPNFAYPRQPYCIGCPNSEGAQANQCAYCELEILAGRVPSELADEQVTELAWMTSRSLDGELFLESLPR